MVSCEKPHQCVRTREPGICCQCVTTASNLLTSGVSHLRMPHRSKREKETKSGKSGKSGSKNGPAENQDGSNKKVPPAAQVMRVKQPGSHSATKREKRFSTSSFPLSANRELQKLPALAG
ncbi:uncharacterized protein LOC120832938 [Gasterosteus aculeatus]|nr:serine/threonine-protein phosphatase 2A 56 kDa regulatory subunit delta isoform-like isoform X2 [Gasterosteus aculeatus aculeatus]